jgi:hypothetical protein
MPARRSRTERWRESLNGLVERNGPIEISINSPDNTLDLIWRVRLLGMDEESLVVEQPSALHKNVPLVDSTELIGGISIGQNRWMFRSHVVEHIEFQSNYGATEALRISMPMNVERCQRRNFYRTSTTALTLPPIRVYRLDDAESALPLEIATQSAVVDALAHGTGADPFELAKPDLGESINTSMVNIGGGGIGLLVPASEVAVLNKHHLFWMRLDLTPAVPIPLGLTARLAHTRVDSSGDVHAGFAFDFIRNRSYEPFIAEQVCRYIANLQKPDSGHRQAA